MWAHLSRADSPDMAFPGWLNYIRTHCRRESAQAEEVRGAIGMPERVVLDRVGAGTKDAAERLAPRAGSVVCELPRLP